jgi:hypothetical protein
MRQEKFSTISSIEVSGKIFKLKDKLEGMRGSLEIL